MHFICKIHIIHRLLIPKKDYQQSGEKMKKVIGSAALLIITFCSIVLGGPFNGVYYSGQGDTDYLQLLDISRRMFSPDPEFQNISMLYTPWWNGFVEGPTWDAWWVQNSYGPTYSALPFLKEPYITFLQNAQDLWFDQMGDGVRMGANDWVAPDGCLCDCARPGWIMYKQGDGKIASHDWGMEFTAAGMLLQAELLLIGRDQQAISHYLPKLERCAQFIETRRDRDNNLFLAGPAGNLLAPSFAGWKKPDGTFGKAYLTGLSITYIAALDRFIELLKMTNQSEKAHHYLHLQNQAKNGLENLITDEGYFIKSLDPDGTKHGVYGATQYGYFESSPNHDAIAFRVADDNLAQSIYSKISSIPNLRRHNFIIANEPGLDDMYDPGTSWLWKHGTWVNGGHWSTCEARMVLGYYRLGKFEDARSSMEKLLSFARDFRMDNPLVEFGSKVYQPKQPINLCYDSFGPPAAFVRGLFEYIYKAESLTLYPHIPPGITRLEQKFPIRFGDKKLFLATIGQGDISGVTVNGNPINSFDAQSIKLNYEDLPENPFVEIRLGSAFSEQAETGETTVPDIRLIYPIVDGPLLNPDSLTHIDNFYQTLVKHNLANTYQAQHAALIIQATNVASKRRALLEKGLLNRLPGPSSLAADKVYAETVQKLLCGFVKEISALNDSASDEKRQIYSLWNNL